VFADVALFPILAPPPVKFPKKTPYRRRFHCIAVAVVRVGFRVVHVPHKPATGGGFPGNYKNEIPPTKRRRARGGVERAAAGVDTGRGGDGCRQ